MLSKRDQYLTGLSHSAANAQRATSKEFQQLWSGVADSYRTLVEFEDRYPTKPDGDDGSADAGNKA